MPAKDGKSRERVATREEAASLVEALPAVEKGTALSWQEATAIRGSSETAVALARRFGVSDSLIGKVRRGVLYRTIDSCRSPEASHRAGGRSRSTPACAAARSAARGGRTSSGTPMR